ncbi:DUF2303 family protein [Vandammella animalimorsus]|nr:DUF2303 family protein [Vandammella animalimorsus]
MFDKQAIETLQEGQSIAQANEAMATSAEARHVVALPSDYKQHDLEPFQPRRRRARGKMETPDLQSFAAYATAHAEGGASIFIEPENMRATAVLNLGQPAAPGQADNKAVLEPTTTAAYNALNRITAGKNKQQDVAEFLEDWTEHITCFNDEGEISPPRAIAAVRKISIEASRKLENEEQALSATRSAFENITASSKEPLPALIYFRCQPYADLQERQFVLRLGVLTGEEKPAITLRVIKREQHQQQMAEELAERIRAAMGSADVAIYKGQYHRHQ